MTIIDVVDAVHKWDKQTLEHIGIRLMEILIAFIELFRRHYIPRKHGVGN